MNKITEIMKSYHGRFVPMFHWFNHTPMKIWYNEQTNTMTNTALQTYDGMKIWYNEQTNTICVDCGVSKMLPDDIESFDENMYCNILYELETEIINSFRKNGIELYGVDD